MVWQQQTTQQYPLHTWSPLNGASHFKLKFEEYTYIIKAKQFIEEDTIVLEAGQSIKIEKNTRVQYSNPFDEPCEYIAICTPAFDFNKVHREE
jgi:mannose-6-phosphate isomerase-like protein (cupin superfamily)